MAAIPRSPRHCFIATRCPAGWDGRCRHGCDSPKVGESSPRMSASSTNPDRPKHGSKEMSLDDLPAGARPRHEPETVVRRVDRASPYQDKITRAEELRLQLADEIV